MLRYQLVMGGGLEVAAKIATDAEKEEKGKGSWEEKGKEAGVWNCGTVWQSEKEGNKQGWECGYWNIKGAPTPAQFITISVGVKVRNAAAVGWQKYSTIKWRGNSG